jgi:hypothetical protein
MLDKAKHNPDLIEPIKNLAPAQLNLFKSIRKRLSGLMKNPEFSQLVQELREKIIPICSSCKKCREPRDNSCNDVDQSSGQADYFLAEKIFQNFQKYIETFFRILESIGEDKNSLFRILNIERFSHGLCPCCAEELYSKEDWYIERKEEKAQKNSQPE